MTQNQLSRPAEALQTPSTDPLLQIAGLHVSYGKTRALIDANLEIAGGEIHALIGENGCGKSTLVKTISGVVQPSEGRLRYRGEPVHFRCPRDAQDADIMTVYQETLVVDELTVLDNLCLGLDGTFRAGLCREEARARAIKSLEQLGLDDVGLEQPLWQLPLSRRHLVAVARTLMRPWSLLILDEATAALDVEDRRHLFDVIRRCAADGRGILYISHRMDEIEDLAARVTVLRSGRTVGLLERAEMTRRAVLDLMSPPTLGAREQVNAGEHALMQAGARTESTPVMSATNIRLRAAAATFDLDVQPGEILGLAGLEGHGQVDFLRCLAGWSSPHSGRVEVATDPTSDRDVRVLIKSPRHALRRRVAYVPGDRKRDGIFGALSVLDNVMLPSLRRFATLGLLSLRSERRAASDLVSRMTVRTAGLESTIESLSGGNQQKVILARWIATEPRVLLLEDSMRGVDVTAKAEIMSVLTALVADGVTLVLLSTEVEELVGFCHRVAVFREQTLATIIPSSGLTEQNVVSAMLGETDTAHD
jgi:ABC-type sugar transport system ATPase subunit